MKPTTINGMTVPQFEETELSDDPVNQLRSYANSKLRDYFSKRVCVNCSNLTYDIYNGKSYAYCIPFAKSFRGTIAKPESFSCSAFKPSREGE